MKINRLDDLKKLMNVGFITKRTESVSTKQKLIIEFNEIFNISLKDYENPAENIIF